MEKTCKIVRDLLPLYVDGVCSEASRAYVGEHLANCPECAGEYRKYQKQPFDEKIEEEKEGVIARQAKVMHRAGFMAGSVIAAIFCVPILVCLIVNLAAGHALNWFFIVLTSLLVGASLTVVPLMVPQYKGPLTFGSFCASLLLLFGTCCIYTGGNWFFVTASSSLFGLCVVFLPFLARSAPIAGWLGNKKALAVMGIDTLLLGAMFLCIGLFVKNAEYNRLTPIIALPILAFAWVLFLVCRYLPVGRAVKGGVVAFLLGTALAFGDRVIVAMLGLPLQMPRFLPFIWNYETVDDNVSWLLFLTGSVWLLITILCKIAKKAKNHRIKEEK